MMARNRLLQVYQASNRAPNLGQDVSLASAHPATIYALCDLHVIAFLQAYNVVSQLKVNCTPAPLSSSPYRLHSHRTLTLNPRSRTFSMNTPAGTARSIGHTPGGTTPRAMNSAIIPACQPVIRSIAVKPVTSS